jgi:hypothetical protein
MNGSSALIDYTNLGYEALRAAMLARAREALPEWNDFSENDLGVLLVELFAYAADVTLYYQSRIAANLFPETADEPEGLVQLLRLIGYELHPPTPATVDLRLAFDAAIATPIVLPAGTAFDVSRPTGGPLTFETVQQIRVENAQLTPPDAAGRRYYFPVPVVQGITERDEVLGESDGGPNQAFTLRRRPVIAGSIQVNVTEPAGVTRWSEVETLAMSTPGDRHFVVRRDAEGTATVVFGDGLNGMAPLRGTAATPVVVRATYRYGGGPAGNVPAGTRFAPTPTFIEEAINPFSAAGGGEREDLGRARRLAPRLFRTQERAVTRDDYTDLALQVDGVGKVRAVALSWNQVVLYVAPSGRVAEPSELLKRDLLAFLESRRMITTEVTIVGPKPADIYLRATVHAQPYYLRADVQAAVETAVADYLAFERVDFGQPVYLSRVYDAIQSLPQVAFVNVTEFSCTPGGAPPPTGVIELAPYELARPGYRDNPLTLIDPLDPTRRPPIDVVIEGGVG